MPQDFTKRWERLLSAGHVPVDSDTTAAEKVSDCAVSWVESLRLEMEHIMDRVNSLPLDDKIEADEIDNS